MSEHSSRRGQLTSTTRSESSPAHAHVAAALSRPGRPLAAETRATLEDALGAQLGRVRIHDDSQAIRASHTLGARGFAVGRDIFLGAGAQQSAQARLATLAHEVSHSVQQSMAEARTEATHLVQDDSAECEAREGARALDAGVSHASARRIAPGLQCDLEDPTRFAKTHASLFVAAPGGASGSTQQAWQDPSQGQPGTAAFIAGQAKAAVLKHVKDKPMSVKGDIETKTTESELDTDAVTMNGRIRTRFPMLGPVTTATLHGAVSVMGPSLTSDQDYLRQYLSNKLIDWTDVENFAIAETDPRFVKMLDDILADPDIKDFLRILASRVGGFQRGEGAAREIFIHRGTSASERQVVLIHELIHFRSHPRFRDWVDTTTEPRFFSEGFTEWLAQKVMTDDEKKTRGSYAARVAAIEKDVAAHVPEGDIARAYFLGEVWRIESRSKIARRAFTEDTGLATTDTRAEETSHSRSGPGLVQEVAAGAHYRFLNLGQAIPDPKPEHKQSFRDIKKAHLDPQPTTTLRFVGHASTPGTLGFNLDLSRRRVLAFYRLARDEGIATDRMPEATKPAHFGESRPTLKEEDPQTRAFNRRVELFIGTGTSSSSGAAPAGPALNEPSEEL